MKKCRMLKITSHRIFLALAFLCAATVPAQTTRPDAEKQLARDIYKQFIEIPSGFTTGSTTPVAEAAAARLKAAGFPDSDVFLGGASHKKQNLVVRYHGTGKRKPILLLAHIDVVEANREDWSLDPFVLTEKDGYFYGRGTGDDKAQAAIWIANLIQYKKEGFAADRDLIVALTADEEGGGPFNGVEWLIKNHRELIDAEYCLNEGGHGEIVDGKHLVNYLQVSEKYVMNFRLEVHNKGGHSSLPVADNAIYRLAAALTRLSDFGFPLKTNEVTKEYFGQIAELDSGASRLDLVHASEGRLQGMQRVAAAAPVWNAMLRTTCVATRLEGGHAINALPQLAAATVNCRVLPEDSPQYVEEALGKVISDDQVIVKLMEQPGRGPASPILAELMDAAGYVTVQMWPEVRLIPDMVTGATDGRYLRVAGIPTYGIQGIFIDRNDIRFHGRDERIPVESFYEGQSFLYQLVKSLSSPQN
jgi:acetylornithine deacetylase/succinyl-diaminopimelate desuccinylase-like protein